MLFLARTHTLEEPFGSRATNGDWCTSPEFGQLLMACGQPDLEECEALDSRMPSSTPPLAARGAAGRAAAAHLGDVPWRQSDASFGSYRKNSYQKSH